MNIFFFDQITRQHSFLGGKGYTLGLMKNAGFNVPDGLILTAAPSPQEWEEILLWWEKLSVPKLAVRSSAVGEDSGDHSFAGQNSTYLNIATSAELKNAIHNCFQSIYKKSSTQYREYFLKEKAGQEKMNVVLQVMIDPYLSGVFFSVDPRNNQEGWIVEAIEGLGEDLVSGKKNPWHFEENKKNETKLFDIENLVKTGKAIRDFFGHEIDIEWAIDKNHQLKILQARPITALSGKSEEKRIIDIESARLRSTYPADTLWDGGTFSEWSSPPSELTFSIWKEAFSKKHSFSKALKKLGYLGIDDELPNESHSLLERVFNRAYVNISLLAPLYFGPIPYRMEQNETPKLKFDFKKMTLKTFLLTPLTILRMIKVSINLSTQRKIWMQECEKALVEFSSKSFRVNDKNFYAENTNEELLNNFKNEVENFYNEHLTWSLLLITLIEATSQNLKALLKGVMPEKEIAMSMNQWLGTGIHTVTMDMNEDYKKASEDPKKRTFFLQKYGHRGPGELELSNPRWFELTGTAFLTIKNSKPQKINEKVPVKEEIANLKTYKKQVIEKEWLLLQEMLELREKWKMSILAPYAHIRILALEISRRYGIGNNIFWHSFTEIINLDFDQERAQKRFAHMEMSKSIYLPTILDLSKLEEIFSAKSDLSAKTINGTALSPGLVYGEVRVVIGPDTVNTEDWPENTILVAESTDPGWTGLFLKSKAVIVEKGGVLSHCAIVAREMSLPAVSEIKQCHLRFKDGDKLWVDGNNGRVTLA